MQWSVVNLLKKTTFVQFCSNLDRKIDCPKKKNVQPFLEPYFGEEMQWSIFILNKQFLDSLVYRLLVWLLILCKLTLQKRILIWLTLTWFSKSVMVSSLSSWIQNDQNFFHKRALYFTIMLTIILNWLNEKTTSTVSR